MRDIIVAHPGKQHSFCLAKALKKAGMLMKYITTVYWDPSRILYKMLKFMLKGSTDEIRMTTRRCTALDDNDVEQFCELGGLLILMLLRIDRSGRLYSWYNDFVQDRFSLKAAKFALKKNAKCIVMYDTTALKCFKRLGQHSGIIRIQDVSIAARNYTAEICHKDMERCGAFASTYKKYFYLEDSKKMKRMIDEIKVTDHFLVPSSFVKRSLEFNGISEERIHTVPYGVDINQFKMPERNHSVEYPVKFLFAGSIEQRKGIGYLLEAFRQMDNPNARLYLAGAFEGDETLYQPYRPWFSYMGYLPTTRIQEAYRQSDVFVFPSMWEGFGLVILEAMACGLPVICSDHTAGSDIVEDGIDGFVVPAGDLEALKTKIQFFVSHPDRIAEMGKNARKKAEKYSWERYESQVAEVIKTIIQSER